jgi:hypothetical protein
MNGEGERFYCQAEREIERIAKRGKCSRLGVRPGIYQRKGKESRYLSKRRAGHLNEESHKTRSPGSRHLPPRRCARGIVQAFLEGIHMDLIACICPHARLVVLALLRRRAEEEVEQRTWQLIRGRQLCFLTSSGFLEHTAERSPSVELNWCPGRAISGRDGKPSWRKGLR